MKFETVIGLGDFGSIVANNFEQFNEYNIKTIGITSNSLFSLVKMKDPRNYDTILDNYDYIREDFEKMIVNEAKGRILFIMDLSDEVCFSCLSIFEALIKKEFKISVLGIVPEKFFRHGQKPNILKSISGVCQEKARCGALEMMYFVSCESIRQCNKEIGITNYRQKIGETLSYICHVLNVFNNTEPLMGEDPKIQDVCRIATIGLLDQETLEEKLFFDLTGIREGVYLYGISENNSLITKIMNKNVRRNTVHNFYESSFEQYYCELFTNFIQEVI